MIGPLELSAGEGRAGYGVNFSDMHRHALVFLDMVLNGAKPGGIL
jgi:hypothetical protein